MEYPHYLQLEKILFILKFMNLWITVIIYLLVPKINSLLRLMYVIKIIPTSSNKSPVLILKSLHESTSPY